MKILQIVTLLMFVSVFIVSVIALVVFGDLSTQLLFVCLMSYQVISKNLDLFKWSYMKAVI